MINCNIIKRCLKELSDINKTLKDKKGGKSTLSVQNTGRRTYHIIDFEDCVYKEKEKETRCDLGILTNENIIYVELKGSDVKKGVEQLLSTIKETKHCFAKLTPHGRLIVTRFSHPNLVKQSKSYRDLERVLNKNLIIRETYNEVI